MNTMLDIDQDVLEAARKIASSANLSLGQAVSELARQGLRLVPSDNAEAEGYRHGFRVLSRRGEVITPEHVRHLMDGVAGILEA